MSWLRKKLEEATAQINPFDNGRTASTVRAARQAPPAQIPQQQTAEWKIKNAKYGVLKNNPQAQNQFLNNTKAAPKQSMWQQGTGFVRDTLDANTQADQQRRLSQGLPRYYQDQSNLSKITRAAETGGRVTARVLQGIGQDAAGAYDLLTPGHGINRATKYYQNRGAQTDQEVKDMGLDENVYKAGQVPLAASSYLIPGKAVSNVGKIPRVARAGAAVERVVSKVPGATKAIGALDDLAANGTRLERVASRLARSYTQPGNIADVGVDALQNAGHRTSLGQDNSAGTLALDVGMSLGMQGGMNLVGQGAGAAIKATNAGVIQPTTRLVRNVANTVAPVQTTTKLIPRTGRLDLATSDALKAYSNMLVGADPNIQGKVQSDLIARIQQIGKENGVDLTNGSVEQRMARVEAMLNGYLPQTQTGRQFVGRSLLQEQGGYAKNPFYRGDDVAGGLSKEQSEFINDYANMLEGMGAGNGVDITPDGRRISNNVRDASTAGKTMSKQDWFDKARKDIESGKAGFGASDEYKKLPKVEQKSTTLNRNQTGLNRNEPKLNGVERKITETEPKRTEIDSQTRAIIGAADSSVKVSKPSNIRVSDNSVTVSYSSKGNVNIYRKTDGTLGTSTDGLGGKAPEYTKNALELPEVKAKFAKSDPLESLKQEARKTERLYHGTGRDFKQFGIDDITREVRKARQALLDERNKLVETGKIENGALTIPKKAQDRMKAIDSEIAVLDARTDILPSSVKEKGVYFTSDKNYAKTFAGKDGKIVEADVELNNPYVIKNKDEMDLIEDAAYYPKIIDDLEAQGYDGIKAPDGQVLVFDPKKATLATQSQPPKSTPFEKDLQAVGLAPSPQAKGSVGTPSRSTPKKPQRLEVPSDQTTELPRLRQSKANPANQPSNRNEVLSKETPVNAVDSTTNAPDSKDWGRLMLQADEETQFNAVAGAAGTRNATKLTEAINNDAKITKAAIEAQRTGKELNFFAKKDANDRSVGIEQFDPDTHRIEAGMVVDNKGNVVGNHIKVDETGIQVNVGGELVNMGKVLGKPDQWKGKYRVTETMSRNIDRNAPNKEIAQKAKDFLIGGKTKAEANYRTELDLEYKKLGNRIKTTNKAKPRGVSKQQWEEDIFDTLDGKKSDVDIRASYDKSAADAILNYKKETRTLYDSLLERINTERVKFGQAPVEGRKDYITHLSELAGNKSFAGEVYSSVRNSFTDEGMQKTRNGVPGEIAGRSENFKPLSAWNRFMQRRTGDKAVKDPFNAVQAYLEPALYNIHMTESTVRARAIESAFRTAGELQKMKQTDVAKIAGDVLKPYMNGDNGKLVAGFQEYANALAKKTQRWDRQIIDASDASATALKGWQGLQRVGGRATILGNVSSTLSQVLGQPIALADAGVGNYLKGVAKSLGGDNAILQSDFIKARKTKAVAPIRGKGQKILDAGGVPLEKVELASVELVWNTQHAKATAQGYKGKKAVQMADYNTERLVAGRGIADRPEAYRSTMSSGLLQYTLEVSAQNKAFWKDLSVSQKATFMVAALGANSLFGAVTGFKPLPDFLGAAIDTTKDFANTDDERSAGEKALGGVQRGASEAISMNPIASAFANTALSQDQRRSLFGKDSNLGRFEGTAAPIQVIKNSYRAGKSALDGNLADARNSALKTVPFGNQIRKTWTGAEANARGYAVDRNGKKTFETGKNVYEQAQNLLFGTSSTKSAQAYYSGDSKKKTELRQIGTTTTKDEKGNYTARDKYDTLIDAYKKNKDGTIGVNDYDTNELRNTIKQVGGDLNKELKAAGLREIKADSRHAVDYAKYKKSLAGKDELEVEEARKDFYRDTYKSQLDKRTQAFYKLSDGKMRDAINSGKVTKEQLQKAIETDNYLTEKGLQSYLQIGKTLRRELGYAAPGGKGKSGRKSGGRKGSKKGKFDYSKDLFASSVTSGTVSKSLRAILDAAMSSKG